MSGTSLLSTLTVTVNGLLLGAGQTVRITQVRGLDDLPDIRTFDSPRAGSDGLDFGDDLLGGRTIEVDTYSRPAVPATTLNQLRAALLNTQAGVLLISGIPGLPALQVNGRVRRRKIPTDTDLSLGIIRAAFDFECPDSRLYAATETVLTTGPGTATGTGLTPPLTPPLTPGGSSVGGHVKATNSGLLRTPPIFRVAGPVSTGFSLLNATTQRTLTIGIPLAAGEFVDIDTDAKTVLLGGTASRRSAMSGTWWDLPPGDSDVFYLPAGVATGSLMTLRFRSAY